MNHCTFLLITEMQRCAPLNHRIELVRERETDRQTDRERDRDREGERERQRERKERERERENRMSVNMMLTHPSEALCETVRA